MKTTSLLVATLILLPTLAFTADYNLGNLAKAKEIEVFNRAPDPTKAGSREVVFLNAPPGDGLAWNSDVEFSEGVLELEIKGKYAPGQSLVGLAFRGRDNRNSIQYISMRACSRCRGLPSPRHGFRRVGQRGWIP